MNVILETELPGLELYAKGKVRDVYSVEDRLLIVATDRISAFDYTLPTGIPDKGKVLTQLSVFWFDFLRDTVPTHFLTANVDEFPEAVAKAASEAAPHDIAFYLRELAAQFHSYYNAERILVEDEELRSARLALCAAVRQTLANGLSLIGVSAPEKM